MVVLFQVDKKALENQQSWVNQKLDVWMDPQISVWLWSGDKKSIISSTCSASEVGIGRQPLTQKTRPSRLIRCDVWIVERLRYRTDRPTVRPTDWPTDRLTKERTHRRTDGATFFGSKSACQKVSVCSPMLVVFLTPTHNVPSHRNTSTLFTLSP